MQLTLFIISMAVWVNVIQNLVSQIPLHANSVNPMDVIKDVRPLQPHSVIYPDVLGENPFEARNCCQRLSSNAQNSAV